MTPETEALIARVRELNEMARNGEAVSYRLADLAPQLATALEAAEAKLNVARKAQKGGDEPCRTILDATIPVSDTDGLAGERPVPSVPSNAPVAVQSPDQGLEHNPDGLTPEQYGAPEWRLLTKEEVRRNVELNAGPSREIESWKDGRFWEPGYCGAASDITYRRRRRVAQPTAEQRIAETGDGFKIRVELCQQCHCHVSDWVEAEHFNGRICRPRERIAELERENDASNKALAFIKDRITSNDDFDSDELVKVIEERVGRYSQSVEWFAPKILAEEVAELRAANAQLERERDEARAANSQLTAALNNSSRTMELAGKEIDSLRSQLAASEKDRMRLAKEILSTGDAKDRERLDWLQDYLRKQPTFDGKYYWHEGGADTLRAAIDAAMKEAK